MFNEAVAQNRVPIDDVVFSDIKIRDAQKDRKEWPGFCNSIRLSGVQTAILVRPLRDEQKNIIKGKFEGVDGCQRWSASKELGLPDVPINLCDYDDQTCQCLQLILNRNRIPPTKKEELHHVTIFMQRNPKMSKGEVAVAFNYQPPELSALLGLKNLSGKWDALLTEGQIPPTKAMAVCRLPHEDQDNLIEYALSHTINDVLGAVKIVKKQNIAELTGAEGPVVVLRLVKLDDAKILLAEAVDKFEQLDPKNPAYIGFAYAKTLAERFLRVDPATLATQEKEKEDRKAGKKKESDKKTLADARAIIAKFEAAQTQAKAGE